MTQWLNFAGAPPLLIPAPLTHLWNGAFDPETEQFFEPDEKNPRTDYDRACIAAWPGRGAVPVGDDTALVLFSEHDQHTWDAARGLLACGGWLPTDDELNAMQWKQPIEWVATGSEYLLMNPVACGSFGLNENDCLEVRLQPGRYRIEFAMQQGQRPGCFHRFHRIA